MKQAIPTDSQLEALDAARIVVEDFGYHDCMECVDIFDAEKVASAISLARAQLEVMRATLNAIEDAVGPEQMARYGGCHLSAVKDYIARARPLEVTP